MKIIRKYTCYVELEDIEYLGVLPRNVVSEIKDRVFYSPFIKFIRFDKDESLDFFRQKEDIIDYDSICNLTEEELTIKINETKEKLDEYATRWLNASSREREKLDNDTEYNSNIKSLKYTLESLKKYRDNKELYDREISNLTFNEIKKVKLNYVSAFTRTQPVESIPVSASEMEKLDQSIKSKCKQNAYERQRGIEEAKNFRVGSSQIDTTSEQDVKELADISAELRAYLTSSNYSVEQLRRAYTKTDISDNIYMDNPSNCDTCSNYKSNSNTLKKLKRRKNPNLNDNF